jgi:hypothetical protein
MDALSETLRVVRLVGAIFVRGRFTAPWCYSSPHADTAAPALEPGAEKVVIFHLITEGECYVEIDGQKPVRLTAGDVVVFPQGDAHRMTSEPGLPPATRSARLEHVFRRRPRDIVYGGGGARTVFVCGYLACDARLARMLLADTAGSAGECARLNAGIWRKASVRYALEGARRGRAAGVLAKLARCSSSSAAAAREPERQSTERTGWLAGVAVASWAPRSPRCTSARHTHGRSTVGEGIRHLVPCSRTASSGWWHLAVSTSRSGGCCWRRLLSRQPLARIAEDVHPTVRRSFAFRREYGAPPARGAERNWLASRCLDASSCSPMRTIEMAALTAPGGRPCAGVFPCCATRVYEYENQPPASLEWLPNYSFRIAPIGRRNATVAQLGHPAPSVGSSAMCGPRCRAAAVRDR